MIPHPGFPTFHYLLLFQEVSSLAPISRGNLIDITMKHIITSTLSLFLFSLCLQAQPEVQAWGNLRGIRIDGQLMRFESSIRVIGADWTQERRTARERNWTRYSRTGDAQTIKTRIDSLFFLEQVSSPKEGTAVVAIEMDPHESLEFTGAFFHLHLPGTEYRDATITLIAPTPLNLGESEVLAVGADERLRAHAKGLKVKAKDRKLTIEIDQSLEIIVTTDPKTGDTGIYFTLKSGRATAGDKISKTFTILATGTPDTQTAHLKLFPDYPGNAFLGMGGNFRLQNPKTDPPVIDYCLKNMEVRMGRVEMPWRFWHGSDSINPLEAARKGEIHPRVKSAMEMAQRLHQMGMPVLLAAWFPPQWAAEGEVSWRAQNPDGSFGNPLRQDRAVEIYASITDYILYLKEAYGVEVEMFSFNESDLGINVRQTAEEHAILIKGLGAQMKSKGLKTKLLLGDTADGNGYDFVNVALDDPETWQYIGAVSFHSWRGWEKETLLEWFEAADRINVPLIIGEGSIDAAAWRYPGIFEEAHYAMEEIKLYTRILSICQPQSILQWQLTADYSPLSGGGVFGNDSTELRPTQRFWNLKQLAATPANLFAMPLTCDNSEMFVAALGDTEKEVYAFHLVNDGPTRKVVLVGLPKHLKRLQLYVTSPDQNMEKGERIKVKSGKAEFTIGAASFSSLISE